MSTESEYRRRGLPCRAFRDATGRVLAARLDVLRSVPTEPGESDPAAGVGPLPYGPHAAGCCREAWRGPDVSADLAGSFEGS